MPFFKYGFCVYFGTRVYSFQILALGYSTPLGSRSIGNGYYVQYRTPTETSVSAVIEYKCDAPRS